MDSRRSQPADESRVLIIYTGGTIGMLVGQQGYVPEPYFLTETLRSQSRFHDPLQDSLFSNSASVEGFRTWTQSGSGRSSPNLGGDAIVPLHTLPVRSSRPIGEQFLGPDQPSTRSHQSQFTCNKISQNFYETPLPTLITPPSSVPGSSGRKRIRYAILEWNPLLDSSNIEIEDWIRIATEVELNYAQFDAFVVLHGTDTMCYTSSALSFMLEDLGKTVILTGAQIPLSQLRNDAVENLMGALTIAGHLIIPECCLYFNHTLYRGNRVSKMSSYDLSAFSSPNFPPLVDVGIDIIVNWNNVIRQTSLRRFRAHKEMNPHVATLRLFPGITAAAVDAFMTPAVRGVVLETFGAGNAPQRPDLMQVFREACERGVVIVAISQCAKGYVSDAYETGRTLQQVGIVPGGNMTPECALTKLGYLLSKAEFTVSDVRRLIGTSLRGELTKPGPPPAQPSPLDPDANNNGSDISLLLSQLTELSLAARRPSSLAPPEITVSTPNGQETESGRSKGDSLVAPWSWTAAEVASTESVLLPFLIHVAAAKNDIPAIKFCLERDASYDSMPMSLPSPDRPTLTRSLSSTRSGGSSGIPGGVVNCLEAGSGKSPLHVAALNGNTPCVSLLLESGALVHLRDALGHTALYYAARQGHEETVDVLIQAGANLGGFDVEGGYVDLGIRNSASAGDATGLRTWAKTNIGGD